jgi:hypothetical protein
MGHGLGIAPGQGSRRVRTTSEVIRLENVHSRGPTSGRPPSTMSGPRKVRGRSRPADRLRQVMAAKSAAQPICVRSPWSPRRRRRHSDRPDPTVLARRRTLAFAQQQSSDPPQRDDCCAAIAIAWSPSTTSLLVVRWSHAPDVARPDDPCLRAQRIGEPRIAVGVRYGSTVVQASSNVRLQSLVATRRLRWPARTLFSRSRAIRALFALGDSPYGFREHTEISALLGNTTVCPGALHASQLPG